VLASHPDIREKPVKVKIYLIKVHLPKSFSFKKAKEWTKKIPDFKISSCVQKNYGQSRRGQVSAFNGDYRLSLFFYETKCQRNKRSE